MPALTKDLCGLPLFDERLRFECFLVVGCDAPLLRGGYFAHTLLALTRSLSRERRSTEPCITCIQGATSSKTTGCRACIPIQRWHGPRSTYLLAQCVYSCGKLFDGGLCLGTLLFLRLDKLDQSAQRGWGEAFFTVRPLHRLRPLQMEWHGARPAISSPRL